jgi:hypothetical protein
VITWIYIMRDSLPLLNDPSRDPDGARRAVLAAMAADFGVDITPAAALVGGRVGRVGCSAEDALFALLFDADTPRRIP